MKMTKAKRRYLLQWVERLATEARWKRLDAHLSKCPWCRTYRQAEEHQ